MVKKVESLGREIERVSLWATDWSGRSESIVGAVVICVLWAISGPFLHFSDTWQLIINTLTSVVTFVMVFLIQRAQNKASLAIQLKLNEVIAALHGASNRLIAVEELSEDELRRLHERYQQLAELTQQDSHRKAAYSVESVEQQLAEAEPQPTRPLRLAGSRTRHSPIATPSIQLTLPRSSNGSRLRTPTRLEQACPCSFLR